MTHTLHPEIEEHMKERDIKTIIGHLVSQGMGFQVDKVSLEELELSKELAYKYLLPPSQHLKDEPTQTLQDFAANQMNVDDMKKDGSFINKVEDNEPLPEQDLSTGTTISQLGKDLIRARMIPMEQSTPKIEKIELTKDDDYWGDTHKKLNEIIDYINNSLPTR